jgi:glycosyltransferase involved in cell wall biosynthesis
MGHPTLRAELGLREHDPLIVSVGNLYPVKGHRYLLEAVARLLPRYPDLHLAIAGQGQLRTSLLALAQALGVEGRLHLLGLRADVGNLLLASDIFVLPSLSEGLPVAMLEAMLAGRPIVATRVGDVPVALNDGEAGLLVPSADAATLAEAIDRLLANPALARKLGEAARDRARSEYQLDTMTSRYETLYQRLLTRATRRHEGWPSTVSA